MHHASYHGNYEMSNICSFEVIGLIPEIIQKFRTFLKFKTIKLVSENLKLHIE